MALTVEDRRTTEEPPTDSKLRRKDEWGFTSYVCLKGQLCLKTNSVQPHSRGSLQGERSIFTTPVFNRPTRRWEVRTLPVGQAHRLIDQPYSQSS
ncbi:hypothetical protein L596_028236 [Steinernema carpocapsae]|uniref:Uncharacterized protein n=1 Tax=Steinernema carpocapsae TaxID=34508 RepID=A0A4V5ZXU2_STECR|nr:hypothetical protein L596_028236 [Steinernema carpocapsae]